MDHLEMKLLIGMHRNINAIDRQTAKLTAAEDLTLGQFAVLEALYSKGDQSVGTVRDRILSSSGTMPVIVKNLQQRGLIERLPDPNDGRVSLLHLTEQGRAVIARVIPVNQHMIETAFSVLTEEEQITLNQLMRKLGGIKDGKKD